MAMNSLYRRLREVFYRSGVLQHLYRYGYVKHLWLRFIAGRAYKAFTCIELSNICNALCMFCTYPGMLKTNRHFTHMSDDDFRRVLQHVEREKLDYISLTPTTGEILCNPRWSEHLHDLLVMDVVRHINFYTNAILLNQKNIEVLLGLPNRAKLAISLSVGGYNRETYRFLYGVDKFDQVLANIHTLTRSLIERNIKLYIGMEVRLRKQDKIGIKQLTKLYNPQRYPYMGVNIRDTFDPLSGLLSDKCLRIQRPMKKGRYPCKFLQGVRFAANGEIWLCGCVMSEIPNGDKDLFIGKISDDYADIKKRRSALLEAWNKAGRLPSTCQPCTTYMEDRCYKGQRDKQE